MVGLSAQHNAIALQVLGIYVRKSLSPSATRRCYHRFWKVDKVMFQIQKKKLAIKRTSLPVLARLFSGPTELDNFVQQSFSYEARFAPNQAWEMHAALDSGQ